MKERRGMMRANVQEWGRRFNFRFSIKEKKSDVEANKSNVEEKTFRVRQKMLDV